MAKGFVKTLEKNSHEVSALEGEHTVEFLRLLRATREGLLGRLSGLTDNSNTLDGIRLRTILGTTEDAIRTLERKAAGIYTTASEDAAALATEHIVEEVHKLSGAFEASPTVISIEVERVLADPALGLLANHFDSSVKRYGLDLLNSVRQRLFIGLRTGDKVGQIVQDVAGKNGPLGQVGAQSAERLVRTEVSQAYGASQHSGLVQAAHQVPSLKKVWLHIGNFICPVCIKLHGTERTLEGTWIVRQGKKTREVAHPPAHPRCICRISAMRPSWRNRLEKLGYLEQSENSKNVQEQVMHL